MHLKTLGILILSVSQLVSATETLKNYQDAEASLLQELGAIKLPNNAKKSKQRQILKLRKIKQGKLQKLQDSIEKEKKRQSHELALEASKQAARVKYVDILALEERLEKSRKNQEYKDSIMKSGDEPVESSYDDYLGLSEMISRLQEEYDNETDSHQTSAGEDLPPSNNFSTLDEIEQILRTVAELEEQERVALIAEEEERMAKEMRQALIAEENRLAEKKRIAEEKLSEEKRLALIAEEKQEAEKLKKQEEERAKIIEEARQTEIEEIQRYYSENPEKLTPSLRTLLNDERKMVNDIQDTKQRISRLNSTKRRKGRNGRRSIQRRRKTLEKTIQLRNQSLAKIRFNVVSQHQSLLAIERKAARIAEEKQRKIEAHLAAAEKSRVQCMESMARLADQKKEFMRSREASEGHLGLEEMLIRMEDEEEELKMKARRLQNEKDQYSYSRIAGEDDLGLFEMELRLLDEALLNNISTQTIETLDNEKNDEEKESDGLKRMKPSVPDGEEQNKYASYTSEDCAILTLNTLTGFLDYALLPETCLSGLNYENIPDADFVTFKSIFKSWKGEYPRFGAKFDLLFNDAEIKEMTADCEYFTDLSELADTDAIQEACLKLLSPAVLAKFTAAQIHKLEGNVKHLSHDQIKALNLGSLEISQIKALQAEQCSALKDSDALTGEQLEALADLCDSQTAEQLTGAAVQIAFDFKLTLLLAMVLVLLF